MIRMSETQNRHWQEIISGEIANMLHYLFLNDRGHAHVPDVALFMMSMEEYFPAMTEQESCMLEDTMDSFDKDTPSFPKEMPLCEAVRRRIESMYAMLQDKEYAYTLDEFGELVLDNCFLYLADDYDFEAAEEGGAGDDPDEAWRYIPAYESLPPEELAKIREEVHELFLEIGQDMADSGDLDEEERANLEKDEKFAVRAITDARYMEFDLCDAHYFHTIFFDDDFKMLYPENAEMAELLGTEAGKALGLTDTGTADFLDPHKYAQKEKIE